MVGQVAVGTKLYLEPLTVSAPTFVFSPVPLPAAQVGAAYSQAITVSGGTAPYSNFIVSNGSGEYQFLQLVPKGG